MKFKYVFAEIFIAFSLCGCKNPKQDNIQNIFNAKVDKCIKGFISSNNNDTLCLSEINALPWDTVYAFWGYSHFGHLRKEYPKIDWTYTLEDNTCNNRFIFVYNKKAVLYLNVPQIANIHFKNYYLDKDGSAHPGCLKNNAYYNCNSNTFSRREAKFVLTKGIYVINKDLPNKGVKFFKYAPYSYFKNNKNIYTIDNQSIVFGLHPTKGCGLPNCLVRNNN